MPDLESTEVFDALSELDRLDTALSRYFITSRLGTAIRDHISTSSRDKTFCILSDLSLKDDLEFAHQSAANAGHRVAFIEVTFDLLQNRNLPFSDGAWEQLRSQITTHILAKITVNHESYLKHWSTDHEIPVPRHLLEDFSNAKFKYLVICWKIFRTQSSSSGFRSYKPPETICVRKKITLNLSR